MLAKFVYKEFSFSSGTLSVIVGGIVGLIAVWLGVTLMMVQDWLLIAFIIALAICGVEVVLKKLDCIIKIDKVNLFVWTLNVGPALYIVLFLVAFFLWFLPMVGTEFAFYELDQGALILKWFAESVAQVERDAITAYIIFGFPIMAVFSYYALAGAETK